MLKKGLMGISCAQWLHITENSPEVKVKGWEVEREAFTLNRYLRKHSSCVHTCVQTLVFIHACVCKPVDSCLGGDRHMGEECCYLNLNLSQFCILSYFLILSLQSPGNAQNHLLHQESNSIQKVNNKNKIKTTKQLKGPITSAIKLLVFTPSILFY